MNKRPTLLNVKNLSIGFGTRGTLAVDGLSFQIGHEERVGLIGESGSGKSVTALALMGLLDDEARISGQASLEGEPLLNRNDRVYARLRGSRIAMVFQEPMTALDPTMKVGRQVAEVVRLHQGAPRGQARPRVAEMLASMGIKETERVMDSFPHQLSGGQRQRVLIAMALINTPNLLVCDEPTTALDVSVQSRVLWRLGQGLKQAKAAMLFISHDLALVSQVCERIMVMYRGRIVETGTTKEILSHPKHPYTKGLIATADLISRKPGEKLPVLEDFWNPDQPSGVASGMSEGDQPSGVASGMSEGDQPSGVSPIISYDRQLSWKDNNHGQADLQARDSAKTSLENRQVRGGE